MDRIYRVQTRVSCNQWHVDPAMTGPRSRHKISNVSAVWEYMESAVIYLQLSVNVYKPWIGASVTDQKRAVKRYPGGGGPPTRRRLDAIRERGRHKGRHILVRARHCNVVGNGSLKVRRLNLA